MAFAIQTNEQWQVIGFNKDGTQQRLYAARSLRDLLIGWSKEVTKREALGAHNNTLSTFTAIKVWNVEEGFTGLDLPYIATL
jgi:hypothetical protein